MIVLKTALRLPHERKNIYSGKKNQTLQIYLVAPDAYTFDCCDQYFMLITTAKLTFAFSTVPQAQGT